MIKCKQAENASCGKVICCFTCEEKDKCADACQELEEGQTPLENCDEAEEIGEVIDLNKQVPDVIKAISDLCKEKKKLEEKEKTMREALKKAMEDYGVKKFENDIISVTYVAPSKQNRIDSAKLKKELPDVASKYNKQSNVSAFVKITVKWVVVE